MATFRTSLLAAIVCLTISSGTRAQEYIWHTTHSAYEGNGVFSYTFNALDSWGEVVTVAGARQNDTLKTNDRNVLIFCRSIDGGETWTEQDAGLPHFESTGQYHIREVQQIDSLNCVGIGDSGLVVRTTNGGNTWSQQDLSTVGNVLDINFSDPMTGIAVTVDSGGNGDIYTTTNGGNSWELAKFHPRFAATQCHSFGNGQFRVCIHGGSTVYETSDNWNTMDSLPPIIPSADKLDEIWAGAWKFRGNDTIVAYGGRFTANITPNALILKSIDGGNTWMNTGVNDSVVGNVFSMSSLNRSIVFCSGISSFPHILASLDHGMTWNLDTLIFDTTHYLPQNVCGVTVTPSGQAVAILGLPTLGPSLLECGIPENAGVHKSGKEKQPLSVFPNPASQTITITSANSGKNFEVLDILGREVLHGVVPTSGSFILDISSLDDGLYYVTDGYDRAQFLKE